MDIPIATAYTPALTDTDHQGVRALDAVGRRLVLLPRRLEGVLRRGAFGPPLAAFPEGITVDKTGSVYVSLTLRDESAGSPRTAPQSAFAEFAPGTGPVGLAV